VRAGKVFKDGTIPYQRFRAWQLAGRTAGIVGLGAVGRATRWRLEGLGMRVIAHDPFNDDATHSLDALLAEADVVSMHAAVTPATVGLIGAGQFAAMPAGALYLNTARAGLHDTDALVDALASGHLAGAGLDHVNGEVLPRDHPLCTMDNVVITPHIGGATYDVEINQTAMIVDDLGRVLRGERPSRCANPEVFG
jgi:D-3-phosphoglycerate dehydrogenase